ncbi:type II toxin-antitoxin system Phd/YefM family antitoxin [Silvibacterium acidisoli]|uniref:type II toxin-antitoxin system Phd/YefM family antitoxin n=1 Tax=Acidobacteriaceae bacterium ZG23-2 TaxID=2883246 RepID=UPI00406D38ED
MKTMPAGKFKTHCLSVIDEIYNKHEEIVITKHGKPMARVVPLKQSPPAKLDDIFGFARGMGKITGDIVSPVDDPESWNSEK